MSDLARAVGAPATIQIDGTTYLCGPLTISDFGALQRYIETLQPDVLGDAIAAAESTKDERVRKLLIESALAEQRRAKSISFEQAINFAVQSFPGIAFMVWLGIEKHKPGAFTFEALQQRVEKMDMRQFQESIIAAAGLDSPNSRAPADGATKASDGNTSLV